MIKIKYFIISAVLATAILCSGGAVFAVDNSALIAQIQAQIQALLQQIAQLQSQQGTPQAWCHTFNSNLQIGNSGSEVAALHEALRENGLYGNLSAFGTSDFDSDTVLHVKQFQAKYGIAQVGIVGPITRAKLNQLYGCTNSCIAEGGTVTGPVAPQYQTVCCSGLIAQYPAGLAGASGVCIRPGTNCPQYSPPAPGWCANGTIISGGYNSAGCPNPPQCSTSSQISITGVSGPTSLAVGQTGTWTVNATVPTNSQISYSVNWGDQPGISANPSALIIGQNSATFNHAYSQAGTYTVNFLVKSTRSVQCFAYPCPDPVEDIARTSITVVVGNNNTQCYTNSDCPQLQCFAYPCPVSVCINGQCVISDTQIYTILPVTLQNSAVRGQNFSAQLTSNIPNVTNVSSLAWTIISGRLPAGLNLRYSDMELSGTPNNPYFTTRLGGEIYGTPTELGTFFFTVQTESRDGKKATRSYNLAVVDPIQPYITVTSPNGGENWTANSVQAIRWTGTNQNVDLYLNPEPPTCIYSNPACMIAMRAPYVLDRNIFSQNSVYTWIVATDIINLDIPAGQYRMKICTVGSQTNCDVSNNYFTITPPVVY